MRPAGYFNPEWGYLAPAPGFVRILRIVVVAAAVGATAGAATVFSLIEHPAADESVAARTMAVESPAAPAALPTLAALQVPQPLQPAVSAQERARAASAESGTTTTVARPASGAALAESPPVLDALPAPVAQKKWRNQRQLSYRNSLPSRPADHGPLALLRSFSASTASNPPHGQY